MYIYIYIYTYIDVVTLVGILEYSYRHTNIPLSRTTDLKCHAKLFSPAKWHKFFSALLL